MMKAALLIILSILAFSCSSGKPENKAGENERKSDRIVKDTLTYGNSFLDKIVNSMYKIRKTTSGEWRYNGYPCQCENKAQSDSFKCYFFEYANYIKACHDIIGKPCLHKMLDINAMRHKKNNPCLDQMVDPNEIITAFSVFCESDRIENSGIIGTPSGNLPGLIGNTISMDHDTVKCRSGKWRVHIILDTDTVKEIRYYLIH